MAPDDKKTMDGDSKLPAESKSQSISTELDLDKNPIKYATNDGLSLESHDKEYMELTLRSGKHSDLVRKLLRQRIESRAKEFPRWPADTASGVRAMWIESRFWYDRERLSPDFDDDWREYRARYLHSLELDPREPVHVPEYEKEFINPIRRFYMKGGDWLEDKIISKFTKIKLHSSVYRVVITRGIMMYFVFLGSYYWIRYNHRKWDIRSGPELLTGKPVIYPDHPKWPWKDPKTEPAHHWDPGFSRRTLFKDLRDYEDVSVIL